MRAAITITAARASDGSATEPAGRTRSSAVCVVGVHVADAG